jgi:hypothetical protein
MSEVEALCCNNVVRGWWCAGAEQLCSHEPRRSRKSTSLFNQIVGNMLAPFVNCVMPTRHRLTHLSCVRSEQMHVIRPLLRG